jgi:hypothetical protein
VVSCVKHPERVIAYVGVRVRAGLHLGGRVRACCRWSIRIRGSRVLAEPRAESLRPVRARGRPVTVGGFLCQEEKCPHTAEGERVCNWVGSNTYAPILRFNEVFLLDSRSCMKHLMTVCFDLVFAILVRNKRLVYSSRLEFTYKHMYYFGVKLLLLS